MKKLVPGKDFLNLSFWILYTKSLSSRDLFLEPFFFHFNFILKVLRDFYTFCTTRPKSKCTIVAP